jgi:hypothetical protein
MRMPAETTPSREGTPRVLLRTSVLLVMLLSMPVAAGAQAQAEPVSVRMGLSPHAALPGEIARRLCVGFRFELPRHAADPLLPGVGRPASAASPALVGVPLREALLDLPPPSGC